MGAIFLLGALVCTIVILSNDCDRLGCIRYVTHELRDRGGDGQMTPFLRLAAGAVAGTIAMSATYPLDMVRGRLTVQLEKTGQYKGILHCTRQIVAQVPFELIVADHNSSPALCFKHAAYQSFSVSVYGWPGLALERFRW